MKMMPPRKWMRAKHMTTIKMVDKTPIDTSDENTLVPFVTERGPTNPINCETVGNFRVIAESVSREIQDGIPVISHMSFIRLGGDNHDNGEDQDGSDTRTEYSGVDESEDSVETNKTTADKSESVRETVQYDEGEW